MTLLLKMKMTFSLSQTTPEDKGHHSRDRYGVSHAFAKNTYEMTHKKIKMKHSRGVLEQETLRALLRTGWFQEWITV